jgi:cell division protein FtsN
MSRDYKTRKPAKSTNEKSGSTFLGGFVGYALGLVSAIGIWMYLNHIPSPFLPNEKVASSSEKSGTPQPPDQTKTPEKSTHEEPLSSIEEKPRFDFYKILPGIEEPEIDQTFKQADEQPAQPQAIAKNPENSNKSTEIVQPQIVQQLTLTHPGVRPVEEKQQSASIYPRNHPAETVQQPVVPQVKSTKPTEIVQPQIVQQPTLTHPGVNPVEEKKQSASIHPRNHSAETVQQPVVPQVKNTKPTEKYFLQAGSFRKNDDADTQKAKLALLGVLSSIQSIDLAEKGIWYRVRIGPFTNKEDTDKASASLKENGIETQFIKAQ